MKSLPIGIQTFSKIVEGDFVYIDKTQYAYNLITGNSSYYFLSRPRRFGKSLFLSTLKEIFTGNKELFKGLYIYDKYDFEPFPVIYISFGAGGIYSTDDLQKRINFILKRNQKELDIECTKDYDFVDCFKELIEVAYTKYNKKVVILIDEYDKAMLDNIEHSDKVEEIRNGLKSFYSVIKDSDQYIRFVFLTGVTKFSKVSIFSGLNNLEDITLNAKYSAICGYTHKDLEREFAEHLKGVDMDKVRRWYNGYGFLGERVYNPFDILLFISNDYSYRNYWFETGTPTFLINLLKNNQYYIPKLTDIESSEKMLDSFDIDNLNVETILFQAGYLTIVSSFEKGERLYFRLSYPNKEVLISFNDYLVDMLTNNSYEKTGFQINMYDLLEAGDMEGLKNIIRKLFASIPYNNYVKNNIGEYEGYYASVMFAYFAALGIELIPEDVTNTGRIDLTLKLNLNTTEPKIYIIEFKVVEIDGDKNALEQIKEKGYAQKYIDNEQDKGSEIYLVGINFSRKERNVISLDWEKS